MTTAPPSRRRRTSQGEFRQQAASENLFTALAFETTVDTRWLSASLWGVSRLRLCSLLTSCCPRGPHPANCRAASCTSGGVKGHVSLSGRNTEKSASDCEPSRVDIEQQRPTGIQIRQTKTVEFFFSFLFCPFPPCSLHQSHAILILGTAADFGWLQTHSGGEVSRRRWMKV